MERKIEFGCNSSMLMVYLLCFVLFPGIIYLGLLISNNFLVGLIPAIVIANAVWYRLAYLLLKKQRLHASESGDVVRSYFARRFAIVQQILDELDVEPLTNEAVINLKKLMAKTTYNSALIVSASFENELTVNLVMIRNNDKMNPVLEKELYSIDEEIATVIDSFNSAVVQYNRSIGMTSRAGLPMFGKFRYMQQISLNLCCE